MDEAVEQLAGLQPGDIVDPASLLFHQALAHHHLLAKEPCLASITRLLENESEIPKRYATVARLMEADLKPLKTDSLDEVSRLMKDVGRRLTLARAGKKVRDEEDEIIKKLEKMIEEMEKKQQQQQQQADSGPDAQFSAERQPLAEHMAKERWILNLGKKEEWNPPHICGGFAADRS
jgi:hypothetical protein